MRRVVAIALALALCLLGCTGEVKLLTGGHGGCSIGGTAPMSIVGVLIVDRRAGTAIMVDPAMAREWGPEIAGSTLPVRWPPGFTARWLPNREVEVLSAGEVIVTTGRRVALSTQFGGGIDAGAYTACYGTELPA
jgi:hypothetical protein